jgi:hypothetical protein
MESGCPWAKARHGAKSDNASKPHQREAFAIPNEISFAEFSSATPVRSRLTVKYATQNIFSIDKYFLL